MSNSSQNLVDDHHFQTAIEGIRSSASKCEIESLDDLYADLQAFSDVRRREVRLALLEQADRKIAKELQEGRGQAFRANENFTSAVARLRGQIRKLAAVLTPELDNVIVLLGEDSHPLREEMRERASKMGFSKEEFEWLLQELEHIGYRPLKNLCPGGFKDLLDLVDGLSVGENGLLVAGFARFSGDPERDERLGELVLHFRENGVTASIFVVLIIVTIAQLAVSGTISRPS